MTIINSGCGKGCQSYPCALPRTTLSRGALKIFHQTLDGTNSPYGELDLFDDQGYQVVNIWESSSHPIDGTWTNRKWRGIGPVRDAMKQDMEEPACRFIFIITRNSREPLDCTPEQLVHILTHYQVMALFLENIFTFTRRSEPHLFATFRSEDYLWGQKPVVGATNDLVGGNLLIQHCFNLVGLEYEGGRFNFRQAAVYYQLDMSSGKTVWIVIKGNKVIRHIIEEFTQGRITVDQLSTPLGAFLFGLDIHLLIYEWATQTWMPYINSLQQNHNDLSNAVKHVPVEEKTRDERLDKFIVTRASTMTSNRQNSGLHQRKSWPNKLASRLSFSKRDTGQPDPGSQQSADVTESPDLDVTQIFSIRRLQSLHSQITEVQQGILVLDQNKAVLQDMVKRFGYFRECTDFRRHMGIGEGDPFQGFFHTCDRHIRELERQGSRLSAILAHLERVTDSFGGILQHGNSRLGEAYARMAKASADKMEKLSVKASHEAASIHAITMLTLLFLPGTFVATFLSSGIIDLEYGEDQDNLGYWKVRWGALRLFGVVVGPLMSVVLAAWAVTYYLSSRRQRIRDLDAA